MAHDARTRSFIYAKLAPALGDNAHALMLQFPSIEADELVTKHFLRAELAERVHQQTVWLGYGLIAATTLIIAAIPLLT